MYNQYSQLIKFLNTEEYKPFNDFVEDFFKDSFKKKELLEKIIDKTKKDSTNNNKKFWEDTRLNADLSTIKQDDYEYCINRFEKDKIEIHILCPNVSKDEIKISVSDKKLIVSKNNLFENIFKPKFKKIVFDEDLSNIDVTNITSTLENGVLTIILPKLMEKKDEPISIKVN